MEEHTSPCTMLPDALVRHLFCREDDRIRIERALHALEEAGACAYLVGGAVRDLLLKKPIKDIDIEVHGIELPMLSTLLAQFADVDYVGKSFGVLKWHHMSIDWSLPRRDFSGRKPVVIIDPSMAVKDALSRRDLTINAMALNLLTGELVDPFGGWSDLINRRARSPNPNFFTEDPLRFYRVMQFVGRFELEPDPVLNKICATMDLKGVSAERIHGEFDKLFLKAARPSYGLQWIKNIGRLYEVLPELAMTVGVMQEFTWHPEGDVFTHLMQALDAAAQHTYSNDQERLLILSATLCHDLGKALETRIVDGKIRSAGHDDAGAGVAQSMMNRITSVKKRIASVVKLVVHHMAPGNFIRNNASGPAYKRLAVKLHPEVSCRLLTLVADADMRGRNGASDIPLDGPVPVVHTFIERAQQLGVFEKPERPLITGEDLKELMAAGPEMGRRLKQAYEMQINERITSKEKLLKRLFAKAL